MIRFKSSKNSLHWAFVRLELNCWSLLRFKNISILKGKYQFLFRMTCMRFQKQKNILSNRLQKYWAILLIFNFTGKIKAEDWCNWCLIISLRILNTIKKWIIANKIINKIQSLPVKVYFNFYIVSETPILRNYYLHVFLWDHILQFFSKASNQLN